MMDKIYILIVIYQCFNSVKVFKVLINSKLRVICFSGNN